VIGHETRRISQTSLHIGTGELGIFLKHVFDRIACGQELQDCLTAMRVPRTTERPLQTSGLIEMRSDIPKYVNTTAGESKGEICGAQKT
jgi:hypothetical protein